MLIEILTFSFMKMRLKGSSAKWRPFCLGLNVLIPIHPSQRTDHVALKPAMIDGLEFWWLDMIYVYGTSVEWDVSRDSTHGEFNSSRLGIYASVKQTNIGSPNCLSPKWRLAIIHINAVQLLIGPLGANFHETWIKIQQLSYETRKFIWKCSVQIGGHFVFRFDDDIIWINIGYDTDRCLATWSCIYGSFFVSGPTKFQHVCFDLN